MIAVFSAFLVACGVLMTLPLVYDYVSLGYRLKPQLTTGNYTAVTGLMLVIMAAMVFTFTLLLHACATIRHWQKK